MSEEKQRPAASGAESERRDQDRESQARNTDTEIPAIRHVGRTLESDPDYVPVESSEYSTPEAQIAAEGGRIDADQRQIQEDDFDSLAGRTAEDHPERLRTRLPGDQSSDPHTDVGPDNATSLQEREDVRREDVRREDLRQVEKPDRA